jgi:hypothetical protein
VKAAFPLLLVSVILAFGLFGCQPHTPAPSPIAQTLKAKATYQPLPPVTNADSSIVFANTAVRAGLNYRWVIPGRRPLNILQTIGNGCAFLDYDNDGNLDILLIGSRLALYKGDGAGHFTDVTHSTRLDTLHGHFLGCAVGDYDNDGYDDVYISGYRTGILLHNEHGSYFQDVTKQAGLKPQPWGTSCAFADLDGDGYLDLFVSNYVQFDASTPQLCPLNGIQAACSPTTYHRLQGVLYHNLAGRRFEDVTVAWNARPSGNDLGVACADFDGSGHVGLAVANDALGGDLFRNPNGGRMVNISIVSGTSYDRFGHYHSGMGIDWGDYDNDGRPDLFVTTFAHEDKCLYHNMGGGAFEERGVETGVASALEPYVSFGCKFADFDNDGWLDLIVASGHVEDNVAQIKNGESYRQPLELLRNTGRPPITFERVTRSAGLEKLGPIIGRGLAVGDFDNDGRMDVLAADSEGTPVLLHNETRTPGHWLGLKLVGKRRSNRDAYGAVVTVEVGKQRWMRLCRADGSYLSSSDKRVHIGLGKADHVERVTVRWPDGHVEIRTGLPIDRYLSWTEGEPPRG